MPCLAKLRTVVAAATVAFLMSLAGPLHAASPEVTFAAHEKGGARTVDHAAFSRLLATYVQPAEAGLNRVDYAAFKSGGHAALKAYVAGLEATDVARLDRPEQFAFWANLYNAKTLDIVLDKYPIQSIKDISLGGTLLANVTGGPWKAKVVKVAGTDLSLDDIEHGILRPIFKDPRVHYAVNCASVGCPNLGREAWKGATLESDLDQAARAFINSPRGIDVKGGRVVASSIYNWFQADFGGSEANVLAHVARYADPLLKSKLQSITGIADFKYDWRLNDTRP